MSIKHRAASLYRRAIRPMLARAAQFVAHRSYALAFASPVRDFKPDIIHAHDGVTFVCATELADQLGAYVVLDNHELEAHRSPPLSALRRLQVEAIERRALRRADKTMTVTERAADYLASRYGIVRPAVVLNAPPEDPGPLPGRWDVIDRPDVRSDLMLHPKDFLFVYTGNVTRFRGLELAIIALGKLQGYRDPTGRFRSRYALAVVGKIQNGHDEIILNLARDHGVPLHLLPPVSPHRVAAYIATANASIIPIIPVSLSYEYAMPNKLFEAMFSGNPIIASDLIEMGPFIESQRLGLTYRADDPDDCASVMMRLIANYPIFARTSEEQRRLHTLFAWEAQERKLLALYDAMLSRPPQSRFRAPKN